MSRRFPSCICTFSASVQPDGIDFVIRLGDPVPVGGAPAPGGWWPQLCWIVNGLPRTTAGSAPTRRPHSAAERHRVGSGIRRVEDHGKAARMIIITHDVEKLPDTFCSNDFNPDRYAAHIGEFPDYWRRLKALLQSVRSTTTTGRANNTDHAFTRKAGNGT